jgi:hypothetical protein
MKVLVNTAQGKKIVTVRKHGKWWSASSGTYKVDGRFTQELAIKAIVKLILITS